MIRGGKVNVVPEHRVNLHQIDSNKQARLHSANNLVRRVGDNDQALMTH